MLQNQHLYKKTCCFTTQCPLFGKAPKKSTTCSRKTRTVDFFGENGVQKVDFRKCWKSITQTKCCFLSKLGLTKSAGLFPPRQVDISPFQNVDSSTTKSGRCFSKLIFKTGVHKNKVLFPSETGWSGSHFLKMLINQQQNPGVVFQIDCQNWGWQKAQFCFPPRQVDISPFENVD